MTFFEKSNCVFTSYLKIIKTFINCFSSTWFNISELRNLLKLSNAIKNLGSGHSFLSIVLEKYTHDKNDDSKNYSKPKFYCFPMNFPFFIRAS